LLCLGGLPDPGELLLTLGGTSRFFPEGLLFLSIFVSRDRGHFNMISAFWNFVMAIYAAWI
jgi:hypothetical protein